MSHCLFFWFKPVFNANNNAKQVMAKVRKILEVEARNLIVQMYKQNTSQTEIVKLFLANQSTICKIIKRS